MDWKEIDKVIQKIVSEIKGTCRTQGRFSVPVSRTQRRFSWEGESYGQFWNK